MESLLRAALIDWLRTDPSLDALNAVEEESPLVASLPWMGIAASASADWSTKDRAGREIRIAFELATRAEEAPGDAAIASAVERRIESLPRSQPDFTVVNIHFLRARNERRPGNRRASLLEYRFNLLYQ